MAGGKKGAKAYGKWDDYYKDNTMVPKRQGKSTPPQRSSRQAQDQLKAEVERLREPK